MSSFIFTLFYFMFYTLFDAYELMTVAAFEQHPFIHKRSVLRSFEAFTLNLN